MRRDESTDILRFDRTVWMHKADVSDLHEARWQDVLEEPADTLDHRKADGSGTVGARFSGGEGHDAVLEADETPIGHGHLEDVRGEIFEGERAVGVGLALDVPRRVPDLRVDELEARGLGHPLCEEGSGDGGQRPDRDKEVDA